MAEYVNQKPWHNAQCLTNLKEESTLKKINTLQRHTWNQPVCVALCNCVSLSLPFVPQDCLHMNSGNFQEQSSNVVLAINAAANDCLPVLMTICSKGSLRIVRVRLMRSCESRTNFCSRLHLISRCPSIMHVFTSMGETDGPWLLSISTLCRKPRKLLAVIKTLRDLC